MKRLEGFGRGAWVTMAITPDGPKWTARSASRCRDRGVGGSGGVSCNGTPDGPKWTAQRVGLG